MNTNVNELNLNEMEMITGGDFWNHVIGAVTGMGVGALVGGLVGGASLKEEFGKIVNYK